MTTVRRVDGTKLPALDRVVDPTREQVERARLFVASQAVDAAECAVLLEMLGIGPTDVEVAQRRAAVEREQSANSVIQAVTATEGRA